MSANEEGYDEGYEDGRDDGKREALGGIHEILNGQHWSPDSLEAIAVVLTANGFEIAGPA